MICDNCSTEHDQDRCPNCGDWECSELSIEEFVDDIRRTDFKEHFRKIAVQANLERQAKLKKCQAGNHQGTMECTGFTGGRIYYRCSLCKMSESEYDTPFDM